MSHFEIQFFQVCNFELQLFYSFFLEMMMPWLSSFQKISLNSFLVWKIKKNFGSRSITFLVQLWLSRNCCCILSTFWKINRYQKSDVETKSSNKFKKYLSDLSLIFPQFSKFFDFCLTFWISLFLQDFKYFFCTVWIRSANLFIL